MNRSRVLAWSGAAGVFALLGGCVASGPAVYGDYPYYSAPAPVYGSPAYVDIDVYSRPNYYGGRPYYYGPRPAYPAYRPGYGPRPYAGVPRPGYPAGPPRALPAPRAPALIAPPTHGGQLRVPPPSSDNGTRP